MEDLIKAFMAVNTGDGYGSGSGDGSGYGYGYGDGDGSGSGSGDGSGYGYGYGDGDGDGSGSGSGDGYGYGYGDGDGYGYGYGSGDGDGYGSGEIKQQITYADYRKGFLDKEIHSLKSFLGKSVYYIDNVPCVFLSIVNNMAKVLVIKDDFTTTKQYIAKAGNLFAHGDSKDHALRSVNEKLFASLSFEEKKQEFIKSFKKGTKYPNRDFFNWHHLLTGSCESGRLMFVKSHGIDMGSSMTTLEFLTLTKNEYNGSVISEILSSIT